METTDGSQTNGEVANMKGVVSLLDEVEEQVETLRRSCQNLLAEKRSLLATISAIESTVSTRDETGGGGLTLVDREEVALTAQRLRNRLDGVQLEIVVQRDTEQAEALAKVDALLGQLISRVETAASESEKKEALDTAR